MIDVMGTCTLPHGEVANTELGVAEPTAGGTPSSPDATRPTSRPAGGSARLDFAAELAWRLGDVERRLDVISAWLYYGQLAAVREALATAERWTGPARGRSLDAASSYLAAVEHALGLFAEPLALAAGDQIRLPGRTVPIVRVVGSTYDVVELLIRDGDLARRACISRRDPVRLVPPVGA